MTGLYEVEIEPEVRSWLASLSNRDFGRVDFLVALRAQMICETRHSQAHDIFNREVD
ncbi:MAG TPA: hypothetical protein VJ418_17205 [Streptosporangiaceae bacterium]|jgi:hypothetical protein|nr:hypothetical protein [Streptosporangiaceae bacterium]